MKKKNIVIICIIIFLFLIGILSFNINKKPEIVISKNEGISSSNIEFYKWHVNKIYSFGGIVPKTTKKSLFYSKKIDLKKYKKLLSINSSELTDKNSGFYSFYILIKDNEKKIDINKTNIKYVNELLNAIGVDNFKL